MQFGSLLSECWEKSAIPGNAVSGFRATGIYPFNPDAFPDYAFMPHDTAVNADKVNPETIVHPVKIGPPRSPDVQDPPYENIKPMENIMPSCSTLESTVPQPTTSKQSGPTCSSTKLLNDILPVPSLCKPTVQKRPKLHATHLTSPDNIEKVNLKTKNKTSTSLSTEQPKKIRLVRTASSSKMEVEIKYASSNDLKLATKCVECNKDYKKTKMKYEWIQCVRCQ